MCVGRDDCTTSNRSSGDLASPWVTEVHADWSGTPSLDGVRKKAWILICEACRDFASAATTAWPMRPDAPTTRTDRADDSGDSRRVGLPVVVIVVVDSSMTTLLLLLLLALLCDTNGKRVMTLSE